MPLRFKNHNDFQEAVLKSLGARGYLPIISGEKSAIDEYIVHKDDPYEILAPIDFKRQTIRKDGNDNPVDLRPHQAEMLKSIWAGRLLVLIYTNKDNYIILNNETIKPLLSDHINQNQKTGTGLSINITSGRLKKGNIKVIQNYTSFIERLIEIFEDRKE